MSEFFEFVGFTLCVVVALGAAAWAFGWLTVDINLDRSDDK